MEYGVWSSIRSVCVRGTEYRRYRQYLGSVSRSAEYLVYTEYGVVLCGGDSGCGDRLTGRELCESRWRVSLSAPLLDGRAIVMRKAGPTRSEVCTPYEGLRISADIRDVMYGVCTPDVQWQDKPVESLSSSARYLGGIE